MKKGKSNYNLTFNSDSTLVNNIVQSYLKESGFNMYEKKEKSIIEQEMLCLDTKVLTIVSMVII